MPAQMASLGWGNGPEQPQGTEVADRVQEGCGCYMDRHVAREGTTAILVGARG